MEMKGLNDVIPLHFSIPIVSVMLILGLVFAFGFKSSSQPPSFDFDDEKKGDQQGSGKKKKRKKKAEQNNKQTVSEIPVKEAVVTEVKETKPKKSNKAKKQTSTKPATGLLKKDIQNLKDYLESESGENEWSTVSSRKDKKNKQASQGNALQETNNQDAVEPVLVTKEVEATEAAVPEVKKPVVASGKISKKKKGKKKPVEDDHLGEKEEPKQSESPKDEVDKSPPKQEEEKAPATSESPKDAEKNENDVKQGGDEEPVADKKKKSPKKGKKKNTNESQVDVSPAPEEKIPEKEKIDSEAVESSAAPPPQTMTDNQTAEPGELKSQPEAEGVELIEQTADDASKKSKKKSKKKKKVLNSEDPADKEQVLDEVTVNSTPSNQEQSVETKQPVPDAAVTVQNSPSLSKKKTKKSKNKSKSNEATSKEVPIDVTPEPPSMETSKSNEAISADPKSEPAEVVVPPPEPQAQESNTEEKKGAWKDATKPKKKKVRRDL